MLGLATRLGASGGLAGMALERRYFLGVSLAGRGGGARFT